MAEMGSAARWLKNQFAEWFAGTWAMFLGYFIFLTIFYNLMLMDGHFSRGLGEGSGVNPDRFQQIGWMFRAFAALFLVFATKLTLMGLKKHAYAVRIVGGFIAAIVILHATGFGLKALEGKRDNANAVEAVAEARTDTNDALLAQLRKQVADIDTQLAAAVEPINKEIINLDTDKLAANDRRSDGLRERRTALEDRAVAEKTPINAQITELIASGGQQRTDDAAGLATNEHWSPLFVGLAQLFTWTAEPSDWSIYIAGVLFIIFWVLVADSIAIVLPDALYRMHLADAKSRKINISVDAFKDLQAQADELTRRKANLGEGAQRAVKTKTKKKKVVEAKQAIEDMRSELAKREAAERQRVEAAIAEMSAEYVDEDEPEETTNPAEPESPPDAEPVDAEAEPEAPAEEAPEAGTDLVPFVETPETEPPEEPTEESDDDKRPLQAAE
jgi:hypothetical protein